ncbi:MAG: hypothetical protein JWM62_2306 [Frankiales bacterium]|jgi:uncharacterized protein YcnI|nr:hypothetical protein [Frankiales bacterium]
MTHKETLVLPARRLSTVAAAAAVALVVPLTGIASAHVTVSAPGATQGGYTKLTFRVPNEKPSATTKLEIGFPEDTPIASVRVKPKDGWTYELVSTQLAEPLDLHGREISEVVSRVIWTATGPGIGATEFDEFEVSAGPLPETEKLVFPALQTYADGDTVRWIEEPVEGAQEPEKPAPVLELAAPDKDGSHGTTPQTTVDAEPAAAEDATTSDGLSITALVVSLLALAAGGAALVLRRRTA